MDKGKLITNDISPIFPYREAIAHLFEKSQKLPLDIEKLKSECRVLFTGLEEFKSSLQTDPLIDSSEIPALKAETEKLENKLSVMLLCLEHYSTEPDLIKESLAFYTKDYRQEEKPVEVSAVVEISENPEKPDEMAENSHGLGFFGKGGS